MADRILGFPTNFTTVSAGGGGNIRVTYAPWELDWEFFDLIATDSTHYLANTTTVVSDCIVAKGGAEHLGYWFEIDQAFPDANWSSGDRITPQRQVAILNHLTFAAAIAAMAANDVFLIWYQSVLNKRVWTQESLPFANTGGGAWGMLSRKQTMIMGNPGNDAIVYSGNQSAVNIQAPIRNLEIRTGGQNAIDYNPNAQQLGAGLNIQRVRAGGVTMGVVVFAATAGTILVRNCEFLGCLIGINFTTTLGHTIDFTSAWRCSSGFNINSAAGRNLLSFECGTDGTNLANCLNCASSVSAAGATNFPAAGNLKGINPRTQMLTFYDLARPGNKAFAKDVRLHHDSILAGAGVAVAGATRDAEGRLRPNPPAIGPYEPRSTAYAPGAEIVYGARRYKDGA